MKRTFKRIMAVIAAAAVAVSLSGCSDNGYIMTVDGMDIRNGVYLSLLQTSINTANSKVKEQEDDSGDENSDTSSTSSDTSDTSSDTSDTSSDTSDTSSDTSDTSDTSSDTSDTASAASTTSEAEEDDIFDSVIDGKSYSDWIINDTRDAVKRFVGIQRECERLGITLTDEEKTEISDESKKQWEDTTISYYGLGYANWGEYYESMGIGYDSFKELALVDKLNEKLFLHYYDKDGEWAVTDEEFSKKANEDYAGYNLITIRYLDYKGDILVTDEEKQEVKDRAKGYADRINNGDSLIDVMYDFNLLEAQNSAKAEAEKSYSEEKAEGLTKEEYIDKAVKEVSIDKADDASEFDEFISKENSVLTDELTDFIFSLEMDGKAHVLEGTSSAYVVVRKSVTDLENWEKYYRTDVLRDMKGDEFDSKMDLICQNLEVIQNDYLVNTKYSPKKVINKK